MAKNYRQIVCVAVFMAFAFLPFSAVSQEPASADDQNAGCGQCHLKAVPTDLDHQLKSCPKTSVVHQSAAHKTSEAPDVISLGALADKYEPVRFDHKLHAEMAEMGNRCTTCHHYSPEGHVPPCRACHIKEVSQGDEHQPILQDAYHQQCLFCHTEWSHESKCSICHIARTVDSQKAQKTDLCALTPVAKIPVSKTYETSNKTMPLVTFQHIQHIELFEFSCADCHTNEKCSYCHDPLKATSLSKSSETVHLVCVNCHVIKNQCPEEDCGKCHDTAERKPIFHEITGEKLPRYCQRLGCEGCHPRHDQ